MSVNCQQATEQVGNGVAAALRGVDCIAGEASAAAFGRLFAPGGSLGTVLTLVPPGKAFVVSKLTKALGVPLQDMHVKGGKVLVGKARAASRSSVKVAKKPKIGKRGGGGGSKQPQPAGRATGAEAGGSPTSKKRGYPKLPVDAPRRGRRPSE